MVSGIYSQSKRDIVPTKDRITRTGSIYPKNIPESRKFPYEKNRGYIRCACTATKPFPTSHRNYRTESLGSMADGHVCSSSHGFITSVLPATAIFFFGQEFPHNPEPDHGRIRTLVPHKLWELKAPDGNEALPARLPRTLHFINLVYVHINTYTSPLIYAI